MFELSACIEWLFGEAGEDFEARIRAAAEAGVPAVEFWGWRNRDVASIGKVLRETGVELSGFATDPALPLAIGARTTTSLPRSRSQPRWLGRSVSAT